MAYLRKPLLIAACGGLLALAACSSSDPGPLVETNDSVSEVAPAAPAAAPAAAPEAPAPVREAAAPKAEAPPPEPPPAPDEQMQEDADATGMTARVAHDAAADNADASAETAPPQ